MALFKRRKSAPEIETRAFADWQGKALPSPFFSTFAGAQVTDSSTLGIPAAWRAVNLISDSVASAPLHAYVNGERIATPKILDLSYETKFSMTASLLLRGNAYGLLDFDTMALPTSLELIHPDEVSVSRIEGRPVYRVNGTEVPTEFVCHVKGFTLPGALDGVGVVTACREALSAGLSAQEHAARLFSEGAIPPLILSTEISPDDDQKEVLRQIRDQWVENHGRSRKPALLTSGLTASTLAFSAKDAQFLESRTFSLGEISNMFGVPPSYIGAPPTNSMTYANIGQEAIQFVRHSLSPWAHRLEEAFGRLAGVDVKANFDAQLRADTLTRYQAHQIALASGWLSVNEVRALEDLPPIDETEEDVKRRDVAETLQKIYLAVGSVISSDEARAIANSAGATLPIPGPDFGVTNDQA